MSLNSDFDALFNEELLVQIFRVVPKLVEGLLKSQALTLRKSGRQQRVIVFTRYEIVKLNVCTKLSNYRPPQFEVNSRVEFITSHFTVTHVTEVNLVKRVITHNPRECADISYIHRIYMMLDIQCKNKTGM